MENGAGGGIFFPRFVTLHCQQVDFSLLEVADGRFLVRSLYYNEVELYIRLMTIPLMLFQYHPGLTQLFYFRRASAGLSISIFDNCAHAL